MSRQAIATAMCLTVCVACGGSSKEANDAAKEDGKAAVGGIAIEDNGRCEFKGRTDREVVESRGPGTFTPNVRRVFGVVGEGEDRRRILLCREIDTNLDGAKDVVRTYNDQGEALEEQADSNYDGKIDTWIRFAAGRIAKIELDGDHNGQPDETRYYIKGKLSRVQLDTNADGKPDVWEIYANGHLKRRGVDLDHDGHVDRWDRDEVAERVAELTEREEEEEKARKEAEEKAVDEPPGAASDEKSKQPGEQASSDDDEPPSDEDEDEDEPSSDEQTP